MGRVSCVSHYWLPVPVAVPSKSWRCHNKIHSS